MTHSYPMECDPPKPLAQGVLLCKLQVQVQRANLKLHVLCRGPLHDMQEFECNTVCRETRNALTCGFILDLGRYRTKVG